MDLGSKICKLRKDSKMSQEQLSEKLNVTRQTISNWELGQTVPDIFQAKEISKIFNISLDELMDNDIKNILVEKVTNTEKMANTTIRIFKFLSFIIICILLIVISLNLFFVIKNRKETTELQKEQQVQEQAFKEYMADSVSRRFNIKIDNQEYEYCIQYGPDFKPISDQFSLKSTPSDEIIDKYNSYYIYLKGTYDIYADARKRITDLKQYFVDKGGSWEEVYY